MLGYRLARLKSANPYHTTESSDETTVIFNAEQETCKTKEAVEEDEEEQVSL